MFRISLLPKAIVLLLCALVINSCDQSAQAQESSFTHQEHLNGDGQVLNDPGDLGLTLGSSLLLTEQSLFAQPAQNVEASGGSYTMRRQVIGAGGFSGAGSYRLTGTVAEVGAAESDSPRFRLIGGFHGPAELIDSIFCDAFEAPGCP
jgi:hypothetical protein